MRGYLVKLTREICVFDCPPSSTEKCYYTTSSRKANAKFEEWKRPYKDYYKLDCDNNETEFYVERELNEWDVEYIYINIKEIEIETEEQEEKNG